MDDDRIDWSEKKKQLFQLRMRLTGLKCRYRKQKISMSIKSLSVFLQLFFWQVAFVIK